MKRPHRILIGTSGFAYKEWHGIFYPEKFSSKNYLSFYSRHFKTTEINNTFYRIPNTKTTEGWHAEVPADFEFTLKLSQKITHIKRLKDVDEEMGWFLTGASGLREKLGPILVQLPPNLKKDTGRFGDFLVKFAPGRKLAFEFRHDSWFSDDVYELLSAHKAAWGVVEGEEREAVREVTAPFVYMRLRKGEYDEQESKSWADWIRAQEVDVYCYLKHDEAAPTLARQLMTAVSLPS